ncbi:pentapeptide repeat-containing protein [Tateyamaria armeniaca]|uniref:Pentapeptide repeat-containing protein n=1 Tax=Tateyamaria armeniaca TaxID=2518930 RepID=A0ABW8UW99_9RHOB
MQLTNLKWAYLAGAQMQGANLFMAQMQEADLLGARMQGAVLQSAQMQGADLSRARLARANFTGAEMRRADLSFADLQGADFFFAEMQGVDLRFANMPGVNLEYAVMEGADLSFSRSVGSKDKPVSMESTSLNSTTNDAGALRFADLTAATWDEETDFRNVFLDASVTVPSAFRIRMGDPCQWVDSELSDAEFYSLWHWWIVASGNGFFWRYRFQPDNVDVTPPTPERLAELGLTDCEPDQPFGPMPED